VHSVDRHPTPGYDLHVKGCPVARLQWRDGCGWSLATKGRLRLNVHKLGMLTHDAAPDDTAVISAAAALDEAAQRLLGPVAPAGTSIPRGRYEIHVAGIARHVLPFAFPEAVVATAGEVAVLTGRFDDALLHRLARRVDLLGGRLLGVLPT
jgi:hypothetical protein